MLKRWAKRCLLYCLMYVSLAHPETVNLPILYLTGTIRYLFVTKVKRWWWIEVKDLNSVN